MYQGDRGRSVPEKESVTVDLRRGASPSFLHMRTIHIFLCLVIFFSPEMYNSLAGGHEALIFLHHKI